MEKKINIAELLKDCHMGVELDCILFNKPVKYGGINNDDVYSIKILIENDDYFYVTKEGYLYSMPNSKCVIFPKGKTTWEGFEPPCEFKDGDIIADRGRCYNSICIFKGEGSIKGTVDFYCGIDAISELYIKDVKDQDEHFGDINKYDFATEKEKQKLFDAIKANGYKWNPENKTLEKLIELKFKVGDMIKKKDSNEDVVLITDIADNYYIVETKYGMKVTISISIQNNYELVHNKFDISTLKPFDKVLVRDKDADVWEAHFFSRYYKNSDKPYICIGFKELNEYKQCIPYDSNKELLDTTNDCDNYFKTWE